MHRWARWKQTIASTKRTGLVRWRRQIDLQYRMITLAGYGPRYPNPFELWPRVPGDIWGYPLPQPVEQPIGFESHKAPQPLDLSPALRRRRRPAAGARRRAANPKERNQQSLPNRNAAKPKRRDHLDQALPARKIFERSDHAQF